MTAAEAILRKLQAAKVRPSVLARALDVSRPTASLMLKGKRGIPTWHLDALAALLETSVPQLFTGSDLLGHGTATASILGGSDVPASARTRIQQLEARLEEREAFIRQVQDAAIATVRLFGLDAIAKEGRQPRTAQPRSRRTHRKVG